MATFRGRCRALNLVRLVGVGCLLVFIPSVHAAGPALPPELEKVRAALEKYQDPYVAVRDGYSSTIGCVHFPQPSGAGQVPYPIGGMGIHFRNPRLISPVPDPMRPQILIYEPVGEKLRLVAAEWLIPLATGIKERPSCSASLSTGPWRVMSH